MNKADLKKIIKPVVKECIHEVLLEEGLLSNVVAEVAKGMRGNLVVEASSPAPERRPRSTHPQDTRKKIDAHRTKLMSAIDKDAYKLLTKDKFAMKGGNLGGTRKSKKRFN